MIAGIDKDSGCRETYINNNQNEFLDLVPPEYLCHDMFAYSHDFPSGEQHIIADRLNSLIRQYQGHAPDLPLLFAICAPCQSFTKFVQRNLTDDRTKSRVRDRLLISQTVPLIRRFKPDMVLTENVAGIRRGRHAGIWMSFVNQLSELGYSVGEQVVCASRFGVPQRRKRSILLAVRNPTRTLEIEVPQMDGDATATSVQEAIGHLDPLQPGQASLQDANHRCRRVSDLNQKRLRSVKPGESNLVFADTPYGDLTLPCHRRMESNGNRGFGDVYTRMHPDRPSPTITTRFYSISNGRFGHYDPAQPRGLSLREGAILQGFPGDYVFHEKSMDATARMIGNAVPPPLSRFFADHLITAWDSVCSDREEVRP